MATTQQEDAGKRKLVLKALFSSLEEENEEEEEKGYSCQTFLQLFNPVTKGDTIIAGLSPKQQQSFALETIRSMQKSSAKRFFTGVSSVLETIISEEAYVPASAFEEAQEQGDDHEGEEKDVVADEKSTECLHFMKYVAMSVSAFLQSTVEHLSNNNKRQSTGMQVHILPECYDVAVQLHNILISLHDCGPESIKTQNAVLSMCEAWWFTNAANREVLIAQCLPLLVLQTLDGKDFQKSHMTKLFKIRDAFQVVDFTNPSSDSLRHLLLRITSNPLCLRMQDGRKFLASLFRDVDLLRDLHVSIRAQIPDAKATVLQGYGEIYYKAWKNAVDTPEIRVEIEHHVLQDLMNRVIHVSSPGTARNCLTILEPFHVEKKSKEVAALLHRSYGPIIWRSLTAANPLIRKNAVVVLEKVFPLHDPSQGNMKEAVSKSADALRKALQDKDPRVRVAGCEATAKICSMFWDALPASEIRMLLNHILLELASDGSSPAVRAAALDATTNMLDVKQSHGVLRPLLPCLGNMIHDKAEKVRLAACRMLIRIKRTPGIKFYHVVPVDHLTSRLSEERRLHNGSRNNVARELASLLLNSYFPQRGDASASLQVQRTMTFLMTDPSAASVFYSNLADLLDIESVAKFVSMLILCLKAAVEKDQTQEVKDSQTRKKRRRQTTEDENSDQEEKKNVSASNLPLMANLAETTAILLESIAPSLSDDNYKHCKEHVLSRLVKAQVVNILTHFEQKGLDSSRDIATEDCFRTCSAVLRIVQVFPIGTVKEDILSFISSSLASIPKGSDYSMQYISSHLSLLCSWGMTEDVAKALGRSIDSAFGHDTLSLLSPNFEFEAGRRRSRRNSSSRDAERERKPLIPTFDAEILRAIINGILTGSSPSTTTLRESILESSGAMAALETALGQGPIFAERLLVSDSAIGRKKESEVEFIIWSCEAFGRLALHREAQKNNDLGLNSQVKMLLDWSAEKVVPALLGAQSNESELRDLDLSRISNVSDSLIIPESPALASPPRQKANLNRTPDHLSRRSPTSFEVSSNDPAVFLVSAAARALLQSSCVVCAELLAVGGSCGDQIGNTGVEWFKLFEEASQEDDKNKPLQEDMIPAFLRLAIQLSKRSNNFALLEEIFKCTEQAVGNHSSHLTKSMSSLLNDRSSKSSLLIDGVLSAFLSAIDEILVSADAPSSLEPVQNLHDLWERDTGCVTTVLKGIMSVRKASLLLVRKLVSRIGTYSVEVTAQAAFDIQCLGYMISRDEIAAACTPIIAELDFNKFEAGGHMHTFLDNCLKVST